MALSDEPRFVDGIWGPHFGALTPGQWLVDGGQSAFGGAIDHLMRLHPAFAELEARAGPHALAGARERHRRARRRPVAGGADRRGPACPARLHRRPVAVGRSGRARRRDGARPARGRREPARSSMSPGSAASPMALPTSCASSSGPATHSIRSSSAAARRAARWSARSSPTRAARRSKSPETPEPVLLGSAMVGAVAAGSADHGLRDVVDVGDRAWRGGAGGRGDRGVPRAKAPQPARCCAGPSGRFASSMRKPRWPEVVIFDCDGVLVDSEGIALDVIRRRLGEAGLRLTDRRRASASLDGASMRSMRWVEAELGRALARGVRRRCFARDPGAVRARAQRRRRRAAGGRAV